MQQLANRLTEMLVKEQIIDNEDRPVYVYGLQLLLTSGLTSIVILIIGWWRHQLIWTVCFLIALISLRHYTGGYHASSYGKCFALSNGIYLGMLLSKQCVAYEGFREIMLVGSLVSWAYIFYIGSINSEKNPKTEAEMINRKRMSRWITFLFTLSIWLITVGWKQGLSLAWVLFYTQVVTVVGLWIVQNKRRDEG